jgi:APA family basic amino acid/polyamine antiporter
VMAILVIISGLGALNGWTMISAEMPLAAARDGIFPERFRRISKNGVPAFGILVSTTLSSIAMLVNYLGSGGATAFTTLVLMTGITAAIPYGFSALAQIKWRRSDGRAGNTVHLVRDLTVAVVALVFSILFIVYSRNTGTDFWTYWAPFILAAVALSLGYPVYRRQRRHLTPPGPVPAYR